MESFDELAKNLVSAAIVSQLLQVPFMIWMGKRINFDRTLSGLPSLGQAFVQLFALGIVVCVSGLGVVLALNLDEVVTTRLGIHLMRFQAGFALFRFERQLAVGRHWPNNESKAPHWLLLAVHGSISALYLVASILAPLHAEGPP